MANYLALRIMGGYLDYVAVVTKYTEFKADIDAILIANNRQDLIVE
ncbi:hypothetical protein [Romboutsia sp.]|nr:hypothetical protein [Romboutsia sp.]HSQ88693.1 hypothetical protein [Romboutsia sp.]